MELLWGLKEDLKVSRGYIDSDVFDEPIGPEDTPSNYTARNVLFRVMLGFWRNLIVVSRSLRDFEILCYLPANKSATTVSWTLQKIRDA